MEDGVVLCCLYF